MTKKFVLFSCSLLFLIPMMLYGQGPHDLIVYPKDGFLNDVVAGDTTASGERVDMDRVYVLKRDSLYFLNYRIDVDGFDVRMKAEDGSGQRPVIYMTVNTVTGNFPGEIYRLINTGGNLWIKDLIMVGYIEAIPDEIQNIPSGLIRVNAAGYDIVIDGCLLTQNRGQHIRTESACRVVKVNNSIFTNMGDLGRSNLGAGKAIDLRDTSCDTLLFVNNTFVNFMDRVIRHRSSVGAINHLIFDHNTIINGGSFHGTLALGWMGEEGKITNNLFIDPFVFGNDTDATRQAEFEEHGELDPYGFSAMRWIFSVPNDSTSWNVSNNYYSISDSGQAFYARHAAEGVTGEGDPLTHHIKAMLGADSVNAFTREDMVLNNIPMIMTNMGDWYRDPVWGADKTKATTNFVRERDDFDRRPWEYFADTLDARYPTSTAAYTGSPNGLPVGDLNWWGFTVIDDPNAEVVINNFRLEQNYPNPFNPSTTIKFTLPATGKITLEVYNIIGQKVATLVDQEMIAGEHRINWDARGIAAGVYFYQIQFNDNVGLTRKMVLLK
jgi:hypothetical protein